MSVDTRQDRSYPCGVCGKSFARSDTLLRHEKSHHASDDRGPIHRVTNGTFRACQSCASARSRCSGGTPCGRCNSRKLVCEYPNKRRKGQSYDEPVSLEGADHGRQVWGPFKELVFSNEDQRERTSHTHVDLNLSSGNLDSLPNGTAKSPTVEFVATASYSGRDSNAELSLSQNMHVGNSLQHQSAGSIPILDSSHFGGSHIAGNYTTDYSSQFLSYDYPSFGNSMNWIPPSIYPSPYDADLEQDFSFTLPPFPDGSNFAQDFPITLPLNSTEQDYHDTTGVAQDFTASHSFPAPSIGLEQSPVSSVSDHGLLSHNSLNGTLGTSKQKRKRRKASSAPDPFSQLRAQRSGYGFPCIGDSNGAGLTAEPHDYCSVATHSTIESHFNLLCLGTNVKPSTFQSPTFPTMSEVNHCLNLYFQHFHSNFPLMHRPTFGSQTHWLVLLAVATVGSTFLNSQYALDFREAFQEFLRRAIRFSDDQHNDASLEVHLMQARILNLVGLVQCAREELRSLAPRYHAELSRTCLESGILQLSEVDDNCLASQVLENGDTEEKLWEKWIYTESLRRIGYISWMLDCSLGYMSNARPLCNVDDARAPLPCADAPWEALSEASWKEAMKDLKPAPSLSTALETLYSKKNADICQNNLSQLLLIHALYQRTWEVGTHIKQPLSEWIPTGKSRGFLNTPTKDNFWLPLYPLYANWRNSACDCLDVLHWQANSTVAKASGLEHTVILHLHLARIVLLTPFQEIQDLLFSFIGKVGNSTKASFYVHDGSYQPRNTAKLPQIRKITWRWLKEDQHKARLAMVHAGSVFWFVRRYSSLSFYEPFAIYLASLVLWTYGSYKSAAMERDTTITTQREGDGNAGAERQADVQPSRMERKEHPIKFINKAAVHAEAGLRASHEPHITSTVTHPDGGSTSDVSYVAHPTNSSREPVPGSDSEDDSSSSEEKPEFIHLDRPCDDEIVQHFVRNGHNMSGHMSNVGDICKSPQKVLIEGAKLLRTKLSCWGVSREYHDILTKLAELRKAA